MLLKFVGFSYVLDFFSFLFLLKKKRSLNTKFMFCLFCKMYGRDSIKLLRFSFNKLVIFARLPKDFNLSNLSFFLCFLPKSSIIYKFNVEFPSMCVCVFLLPFILIFFVLKFSTKKFY